MKTFVLFFVTLFLCSCESGPGIGFASSQDMLAQIRPGMSSNQIVGFIGAPSKKKATSTRDGLIELWVYTNEAILTNVRSAQGFGTAAINKELRSNSDMYWGSRIAAEFVIKDNILDRVQ
jgi:hypothetical protein